MYHVIRPLSSLITLYDDIAATLFIPGHNLRLREKDEVIAAYLECIAIGLAGFPPVKQCRRSQLQIIHRSDLVVRCVGIVICDADHCLIRHCLRHTKQRIGICEQWFDLGVAIGDTHSLIDGPERTGLCGHASGAGVCNP